MATQMFFRRAADIATPDQFSLGTNAANLAGTAQGWTAPRPLSLTRGSTLDNFDIANTVAGTTLGLEIPPARYFISPPLDADVTISGTITFNLWMNESNMAANAGAQCIIERVDSQGAIVSTVVNSEKGTELPVTTSAAQNWTATPTSTAFLKGDRIRIRVAANDGGGTMASGYVVEHDYNGPTAAANGDSYVTFTETFGFLTTDPTTTTIYPTDTVSDIDPGGAGTDTKAAWTSRGSGVVSRATTSGAGWTAPIQATATAGGNVVEWFTKPLTALTLAGPVLANVRASEQTDPGNAAIRAEIAVTAGDGSGAVVWAATTHPTELTTGEAAYTFYLAGDDLAVIAGQRIRIRILWDDSSIAAMGSAVPLTVSYAGTSGGASGDTYLTFGQTLTEYVAAQPGLFKRFVPVPFIPKGRSM